MAPQRSRELSGRARRASEPASLAERIARYRNMLPQFQEDRATRRALLAEIVELELRLIRLPGSSKDHPL